MSLVLVAASEVSGQVGGVTYVYDELGRLVGVVDPAGETAVYTYDAVGNLLSISRRSSAVVSVIEFTPDAGGAGATVTIYGSGFSATAGSNAVAFNGTAATVTSATPTRIVTAVPAGATTGPITVTTPLGTATSATPFQVGDTPAPTITDFSPTVGTVGSALTINGSNFEPVLTHNKVKINRTGGRVNSVTTTSLTAAVGPTGSGRVSVETPAGKAVGGDFFVAPAPYTAADVASTGRMAVGESRSVSVGTANKIGLVVFDGTAGQRVSLNITNSTITSCTVSINNPDGTLLKSGPATNPGGFLDATDLPATGTYTILVDPASTQTGAMTLTLYNVADVTGSITPGGSSVSTVINTPGQNARLTFAGTAGQRVSLDITGNTFGGVMNLAVSVRVTDPGGNLLADAGLNTTATSVFIDAFTLPAAGTYTITLDPSVARTGSATFTLYDVPPDAAGTITPGGPPVTLTTTAPGQNLRMSFAGTAGRKITLITSTAGLGAVPVKIYRPDGAELTGPPEGLTLPSTGTYEMTGNPAGNLTGSMTFTLYDVVDVVGQIDIGGPAVPVSISTPGQQAVLSFTGAAGQRLSLNITGGSFPFLAYSNVVVNVRRPDGTVLASADINGFTSKFIDVFTLPAAGTYTVTLDPPGPRTGGATFTLYEVADVTGTVTIGGPSVTKTTTVPGQNILLTFEGTAGQSISLIKTGNVGGSVLKKPDGTTLASGTEIIDLTLPVTGTYTVFIDPLDATTGSATVTLYNVVDITGSITAGGPSVTASLSTPGQAATLTFGGTAGQRVSLNITGATFPFLAFQNVNVYLKGPDGANLASADLNGSAQKFIDALTLPATGTYTILFDPPGSRTGSATFTLYSFADVTGSVTVGGAAVPVTTTAPGQNAALTFSGTAGQQVTVRLSANTISPVTVRLLKPDGTQLATASSSSASFNLTTQTLPADGTYTVSIDPTGTSTGGISVSLTNP